MYLKFVSLISLMCALAILSVDLSSPSDPLFFIVSGGFLEEVVRFIMVGFLMTAAFTDLPSSRTFKRSLLILGWPLIMLGGVGFLSNSFDYSWYNFLKPLDYLLMIELGVVMNVLALEPQNTAQHFALISNRHHLLISAFSLRMQKLKSTS
jgi:hypothetical protein